MAHHVAIAVFTVGHRHQPGGVQVNGVVLYPQQPLAFTGFANMPLEVALFCPGGNIHQGQTHGPHGVYVDYIGHFLISFLQSAQRALLTL